jgi:hypothetical protein
MEVFPMWPSLLILLSGLPAPLVPQAARSFRPDRDRVYLDEPGDGSILARGTAYKARFDSSGITFYPLFGPRADRHYPVSISFDGAWAGDTPIPATTSVPPTREGMVVSYARGSITEEFELRPEGVEQRFVVSQRLGTGEILVRLSVATDLSFAGVEGGLVFEAAGLGSFRYGEATAIDGRGASRASPVQFDEGGIEIRVPSDFVEESTFPVTIDPILVAVAVDLTPFDDFAADICYDAGTDHYLVIYEEIAVAGVDHDIFCSYFTGAGAPFFGAYQDLGPTLARAPAIANNNWGDVNLAVFEYKPSLGSPTTQIWGRRVTNVATNVDPAPFLINPGIGVLSEARRPDVGGDPFVGFPIANQFCVVWENVGGGGAFSDIYRQLVSTAAVVGGAAEVDGLAGLNRRPRISSSNGLRGRWGVTWENFDGAQSDVYLRAISFAGGFVGFTTAVDDGASDDTNPNIGGNGSGFAVVWERAFPGHHDIVGRLAGLAAGAWAFAGAAVNLSAAEPGVPLAGDQIEPAVDRDGSRFVYVYANLPPVPAASYDVRGACVKVVAGGALMWEEGYVPFGVLATHERRPEVVSKAGAGGPDALWGVCWDQEAAAANHNVRGATYQCGVVGGAFFYFPSACGGTTAPTLTASGNAMLGGTVTFTLATGGLPSLLWVGLPTEVPLCPPNGCILGATLLFPFAAPSLSALSPQNPALLGAVLSVQGAALLAPGGCPAGTAAPIAVAVSDTIDMMIR